MPCGCVPPRDPKTGRVGGKVWLAVWAAAAVPMAVLAWVVAPLLKDRFSGPEPLLAPPAAVVVEPLGEEVDRHAPRDIVAEHSIATGVARTRAAARLTRSAARA